MSDELMFSVIVITYNQEKYISQTLDSILNQEHDYKYEIVIGEDCSTDGTRKIVEEYAAKYPEIIKPFYNNPNKGLIKNYFETIAHCTGKYIMDVAGDDWWLPGKVKLQIDFMEKHKDVGMCYGKAIVYDEQKKKYLRKRYGKKQESFEDLLVSNDVSAPSVCIRKSVFDDYEKEINPIEREWKSEDWPMWLYMSKTSSIRYLDNDMCVYRKVNNSISHSSDIEKRLQLLESDYNVKSFFINKFDFYKNIQFDYFFCKVKLMIKDLSFGREEILQELSKISFRNIQFFIIKIILSSPVMFIIFRKIIVFFKVKK